jgi:hypothetical protein
MRQAWSVQPVRIGANPADAATPLGRGITSLHFCCAGQVLTRGRELSGERPRTLI